ncbi:MAG: sigma factor, partial [Pseudomonadota bacterium]
MVALLRTRPSQADFHRAISERSDRWYAACLRITRNPDLAADAVQDALLSAWAKRDQFQQSSKLDTWIHRIAVN